MSDVANILLRYQLTLDLPVEKLRAITGDDEIGSESVTVTDAQWEKIKEWVLEHPHEIGTYVTDDPEIEFLA